MRALVAASILLVALGAGLWWWLGRGAAPAIDPSDARLVAEGRTVYAVHCASCHGAALEGQPNWRERRPDGRLPAPPHDVSGHTWHHPDKVLFGIVKQGIQAFAPPGYESDMPAYAGVLSDRDIAAVLAFIKAQWPPEIRARQDGLNRAG